MPVDDENTLNICWFFSRVPSDRGPYVQQRVPTWYGPIKDSKGRWISSHIINQDIIAWVGQGTIADRSKELLGSSDRGVAMVRNRFFEEMEKVARGEGPKRRHPRSGSRQRRIPLPIATPEVQRDGIPTEQWRKDPYFKRRSTPLPVAIRPAGRRYGREYAMAMGVDPKAARSGRDQAGVTATVRVTRWLPCSLSPVRETGAKLFRRSYVVRRERSDRTARRAGNSGPFGAEP